MQPFINIGFAALFVLIIWRMVQLELDMGALIGFIDELMSSGELEVRLKKIHIDDNTKEVLEKEIEKAIKEMSDEDKKGDKS